MDYVEQVQSLLLSVELAIAFNPHKDKNRIVQKVCTHTRHRFTGQMKVIANDWRKQPNAYYNYTRFMDMAGL